MARKRMIHPSLITSRTVGALTIPQRYGWVALILHLDDYGRAIDDLPVLRAAMWPRDKMTEKKLDADLNAYAAGGLICRYPALETFDRCLHAPNWDEYQKVAYPSKEKIPPCPVHDLNLHEGFVNVSGVIRETFTRSVVKGNEDQSSEVDRATHQGRSRLATLRDFKPKPPAAVVA